MKQKILSFFGLFMITFLVNAARQNTDWTRTEVMDSFGQYILEWKVDSTDITFTTTVNTRGYIGLGFSYKHGSMPGADLVIAWVDDQTGLPNILVCIPSPFRFAFLCVYLLVVYSF